MKEHVKFDGEYSETVLAKQLFLNDKKNKDLMWLVCAAADTQIDMKALQKHLKVGSGNLRAADAEKASNYFEKSKYAQQIKSHIGDAKEIIPSLNTKWDLVFIDADKTSYIEYYNLVLPNLNKDGLIIIDNVLFHGEVLQEKISGKNATAIQAFNEFVLNDDRTEQTLLAIRDGLTLLRKK